MNSTVQRVRDAVTSDYVECNSPYNDGFVAFGHKQNLWEAKFMLEEMIARCPTFQGEEEYLTQLKIEKAERKLSGNE